MLAVSRGPHGFQRSVVLKRVQASVEDEPAMDEDARDATARLGREALAYARLAHPAIVRLFDFVEDDGRLTLVLEHVDGLSLARILTGLRAAGTDLDEASVWYIGYRVFLALAAAHSARDPMTREFAPVIHRDVSPGNVLVGWDGYAKLGDFGVARLAGVPGDTRPGVVKGTVGYLAPEQVRGEPATVRTDVYAACLLVRELLLRSPVFPRENRSEMELLAAMAAPELVPLAALRPALPVHLTDAIDRGLSVDPEARTASADELVAILRSVIDMETARERLVDKMGRLRRRDEGSRSEMYATRPADVELSDESVTELLDGVHGSAATPPTQLGRRGSQNAITSRPPAPSRSLSPPPLPERATRSTRPPPLTSMVVPRARPAPSRTPTPPRPMARISTPPPSQPTQILAIAPPPSTMRMVSAPPRFLTPPRGAFASRTSAAMIFETPNAMVSVIAPEPPPPSRHATPTRRARGALLLLAAAFAVGMGVVIGGALGLRERMMTAPATAETFAKPDPRPTPTAPPLPPPRARSLPLPLPLPRSLAPPPSPSPSPPPSPSPSPPPSPPSASAASTATTGRLLTPSSELGHRVFVDGRFAGGGGVPLTVRCGRRTVRVGSAGKLRSVDVPCGGDLDVTR